MKNVLIIGIILISIFVSSDAQKSFQIEASEGFVFFDYFGNKTMPIYGDWKLWAGYGLQSDINAWWQFYNTKNIDFKLGLGYTYYKYLYDYGPMFFVINDQHSSYLSLKLGVDYKPQKIPIGLLFNFNNNILLNKENEKPSRNPWNAIIDLGFRYYFNKKFNLFISTPISLSPLFDPFSTRRPYDVSHEYDPWIEVSGINIGINYRFTNSD